jgi:flavin reductase (DIM6/NTAB) family NADH-FMN oxidoreductase RutF
MRGATVVHPSAEQGTGDALSEFRSFMAGFPTGVAVVTTIDPAGTPRGMTCSSVCSVTLTPPTLLVCLRAGSPTLAAVAEQTTFAVNLLHDRAQAVAQLFASGVPNRFQRVRWRAEPGGGPHLIDDAHAVADCRVSRAELIGDHVVVFGEVFQVWQRPSPEPLLYGLRRYAAWPLA